MNATITEISSLYGVWFYVCGNNEEVRNRLDGFDVERDHEKADEAIRAGLRSVQKTGYDYIEVRDFRAYNGGPRKSLVEPKFFVRDALDDGEYGDWKAVADVPAEIRAVADAVADDAIAAMQAVAKS